ncbi:MULTISPECIES: sensor histidine kinase [unclassified Marinovum]
MIDDAASTTLPRTPHSDGLGDMGRGLIEAMADEVVLVDHNGVVLAANTAWQKFCADNGGDTDSFYVGSNYFTICGTATGDCTAEAPVVNQGLQKLLRDGGEFRCEYPCDSITEKRWFELTAARMPWGGAHALLIQHRNITARHREIEDIERASLDEGVLSALVATTRDAILTYDLDGKILTWNPAARSLYKYTDKEVIGRSLEILYPEGWPKRVSDYRDEIIAGTLKSFEATRVGKDGTERMVWVTCAPIRAASGEIIAISNIHRDVTELRRAEEARDIITKEVIHRAKNMLAIVSSIQRQTARNATTMEEFNEKFGNRISALSDTTDLLVQGNWTTVGLDKLVNRHLSPFVHHIGQSVRIGGPSVELLPQAVQTIGMSLHELATNSAKYGALRGESGVIDVTWQVHTEGGAPRLRFEWLESGIKFEAQTKSAGFGHTVLTSLARSMLGAEVAFEPVSNAVRWMLDVPHEHFRSLA